jgi:hypothetical protein
MHAPARNGGRSITRAGVIAVFGTCGLVGCGEDPKGPLSVLRGGWGGPHFGLLVTGSEATALFDCATGTLKAPIPVDSEGHFKTPGDYTREIGPAAITNPALYEGWVFHDALVLTASVTDTVSGGDPFEIGPFVGTPEKDPEVAYCQ